MINPLTDDYSNKVMSQALKVGELFEGQEDLASLASGLVFFLGAVNLLRQEVPRARYDCERFVGGLRSVLAEGYPNMLDHYFDAVSKKTEQADQMGKVFLFPTKS